MFSTCIYFLFLCPAVAARCYDGNSLVQLSSVRRQRARSARTVRWLCTVHTVAPRSGPLACSTLTLLSNCGSHSWRRRVRRCRGLDGRPANSVGSEWSSHLRFTRNRTPPPVAGFWGATPPPARLGGLASAGAPERPIKTLRC